MQLLLPHDFFSITRIHDVRWLLHPPGRSIRFPFHQVLYQIRRANPLREEKEKTRSRLALATKDAFRRRLQPKAMQTRTWIGTGRRLPTRTSVKCLPFSPRMEGTSMQVVVRLTNFGPASYFFSLVGPSVKIYSVATGQNVSTLTPPRPSNASIGSNLLTSAVLNPNNAFQLITGSCNGYIHIWDFLEATLLKTIDLSQPIHHLCVHEKFKDFIFASVTRPSKNKTKGGVYSFLITCHLLTVINSR